MPESGDKNWREMDIRDKSKYWEASREINKLHQVCKDLPIFNFDRVLAGRLAVKLNAACERFDAGENVTPEEFDRLIQKARDIASKIKSR